MPALDVSVAATEAAHATDARVRAQERRLAPSVVRLRRAYEAAKGVPALTRWRTWCAGALDHNFRDPKAARLAEHEAFRVMVELRDSQAHPDARIAAADAVVATIRFREALG